MSNCWCTNLLPFPSEMRNLGQVEAWQIECKEKNLFGIGWPQYFQSGIQSGQALTDSIVQKCKGEGRGHGFDLALTRFSRIEIGDLVLMRLRNAHFYLGRVSKPAYYLGQNGPEFSGGEETIHPISWACEVEKWIEFDNDEVFPSALVGETYKRSNMSTISCLNAERTQRLMRLAILAQEGKDISGERIRLTANTFASALGPIELEDLVATYIYAKHDDYRLLPSSCKISKEKYEFNFVAPGKAPITCQVKNQAEVPLETYTTTDGYAVIYLFSGLENWEEKWLEHSQNKGLASNLQIITHQELFDLLVNGGGSAAYLRDKLSKYYTW